MFNLFMRVLKPAVFIFLFLVATVFALREIGVDSDIWLHIKTGQVILQNRAIPSKDIFSATTQQAKWINHEWLFQVVVSIFYNLFGSFGIIFLRWLVVMLTILILFLSGYRKTNSILIAIICFIFLMLIWTRLNDRPELLSILFTALFIYILENKIDSKVIWSLVPLQVIWANIHGYFLIGIFVTFIYLLENIVKKKEFIKKTLILFFCILAASLVNPYGLEGLLYPIKLAVGIKTNLKIFTYYINELLPPFGFEVTGNLAVQIMWYKALIVISAALFLFNIRHLKISHLVLYMGMLVISLVSIRNIPLFGLIACITSAHNIGCFKLNRTVGASLSILFIIGLVILLFNEVLSGYYVYDNGFAKNSLVGVSPIRYPKQACDFLQQNKINGNLLNNFYCGSYIIFRLYPDIKVAIDGRIAEIYSPSFYKYYRECLENPASLEGFVDKYNMDSALFFEPAQSMAGAIKWLHNNWYLVYLDDTSMVFLKDNPKNEPIIKSSKIDLNEFKTAKQNIKRPIFGKIDFYPYGYINRARLFAYIGLYDKATDEAKTALEIDKNCIPAYNLLGGIYTMQGKFDDAVNIYNQAVKIEPKNHGIYYNLGVLYDSFGKQDKAIEYFAKSLRINPKYQSSRFGLAMSLEKQGRLDEAKGQLVIIKGNDLSGDINCQLGYIFLKEKNLKEAQDAFLAAIKITPKHARSYNGLGIVYGKQGQTDLAIENFKKAIENSARFKEAYDNLATTYANVGDYQKAEETWQALLEIDPANRRIKEKIETIQQR